MSTPVAIAVGSVFVVSLVALTILVVALVRRLRGLAESVAEVRHSLEPQLADLQREAIAAQRELARISDEAGGRSDDSVRLH